MAEDTATVQDNTEQTATDQAAQTSDSQANVVEEGAADSQRTTQAPEKYEAFTLPDGVRIGDSIKGEFETVAKELGLSQQNAQRLVDLAAKNSNTSLENIQSQWAKQREDWVNELKGDREFGGDKLNETVTRAQQVLTKFGSEKLNGFLGQSGYGDNKDLIVMLAKVHKALGEDLPVNGDEAHMNVKDPASVLYPDQGK